jgi:ribosomal protein L35AE/L33A
MNLTEFDEAFRNIGMKQHININCSDCRKPRNPTKEKARATTLLKGRYLCRSCSMKLAHKEKEYTQERKNKISEALQGISRSDRTRQKMSRAKKEFYKTPAGIEFRKRLSILTAKGHAVNKYENAKRNGWHISEKAGKVFYGSSYELLLCYQLDQDDYIKTYETQVYYESNGHGRCLDFLITDIHGSKRVVEVKPESRLNEQVNIDQINDSRLYAEKMGYSFEVYTEINFGLTAKEIRDWADIYLSQLGEFDWITHRKESNNKKSKKHYQKHIAQDKVEIFCEYCQTTHNPLKLTYEKNLARNGKYICEREGGFIAGSKPKKKKENPYASEGKKQCNGPCGQIKSFEEFGLDKTKSDGYATQCKVCRASKAKGKYQKESFKNANTFRAT